MEQCHVGGYYEYLHSSQIEARDEIEISHFLNSFNDHTINYEAMTCLCVQWKHFEKGVTHFFLKLNNVNKNLDWRSYYSLHKHD